MLMLRLLLSRRKQISSSVAKAADHANGQLLLSVTLKKRRRKRRRKRLSKLLPPSLDASSAALAPRLLTRRRDLCQKLRQRALVVEATKVAGSRADVSLLLSSSSPSKRAGIDQLVVVMTKTEDVLVLLMSTTWVVKFLATRTDAAKLPPLSMIATNRMVVMACATELAKVVVPTTSAEVTLTRLAKVTATCPTLTPIEIPISLNTTVAPNRLVVVDEVVAKGSVGETSPALATSQPLDAPRDQTSWLTTSAAIRTRDGTEEPSASQVDGVGARQPLSVSLHY